MAYLLDNYEKVEDVKYQILVTGSDYSGFYCHSLMVRNERRGFDGG